MIEPSGPGISAHGPAISADGPAVSAGDPGVSADGPVFSARDPEVSAAGPAVSAGDPGVSAAGPAFSARGPGVSVDGPEVSADGPGVSPGDPGVSAHGPGVSADDPGVSPDDLRYDDRGLIPVVVQDVGTGAVLMLAYANREAVALTLSTRQVHFWSRSRQSLWKKGETSGNTLQVVEAVADCDGDALLVRALPAGPTCHRGTRTCFEPNPACLELGWLATVIAERRNADPETSYTARLLAQGIERMAQKVGEEGVETAIAAVVARDPGRRAALAGEAADLLYHLLVLLEASGVRPEEIGQELLRRHGFASPRHSVREAQSDRSPDA